MILEQLDALADFHREATAKAIAAHLATLPPYTEEQLRAEAQNPTRGDDDE